MDRPRPTARPNSSSLSTFLAAHFPTRIAETLFHLRAESARGHIRRGSHSGAQRARAFGTPRAIALLGTFGAATLSSAPSSASDGVLEINQTCAVQSGCFAGDTAGLPVTISESGSYRLTSNLVVPNENTDGIVVSTHDVGIDLNNFSIRGPVVCSGLPVACVPNAGTGSGIERTTSQISGISVRNGTIRGMGSSGVVLGINAAATSLRIESNRITGISTNTGSIISDNTTSLNGSDGIFTGSGSTVSGNASYQNGDDGIETANGAVVSGNTAFSNGGDGIVTGSNAVVSGNAAQTNTVFGLRLGGASGYRENVISSNSGGTVSGGVNTGDNACNASTTCP